MSFTDLYPSPYPETATAHEVAGHYAAHALYLMGRAERRYELHGPDDVSCVHLMHRSASEAEVAYILYAASREDDADAIAHRLLVGQRAVGGHREWARTIAKRNGYNPDQVRRAGYES